MIIEVIVDDKRCDLIDFRFKVNHYLERNADNILIETTKFKIMLMLEKDMSNKFVIKKIQYFSKNNKK